MSRLSANLTDVGSVSVPKTGLAAAVVYTQLTPPAGGTGADAGGWLNAGTRDNSVEELNAIKADVIAADTEYDKLVTDVAGLRTAINALITRLETFGVLTA
jgi:hypothetical protein